MDALGKYIAIFLTVLMIFLFPLQYISQIQSEIIQDRINTYISEFNEETRQKGHICLSRYEELKDHLSAAGEPYDLIMEVSHPVTGKEVSSARDQVGIRSTSNTFSNQKFITQTSSFKTQSSHFHTEDCYEGHRHTDGEGINTSYYEHGCYVVPLTYSTSCPGNIIAYPGASSYNTCPNCHGSLYVNEVIMICNVCNKIEGTAQDSWCASGCGYRTNGSWTGNCNENYVYWTEYQCLLEEDITLDCNRVVTSITATAEKQTVKKGEGIITTATATYLDVHTEIIHCSSNYDPYKLGLQIVTLTYEGYVDTAKTYGTKTCTIEVIVNDINATKLTNISVEPSIVYGEKYKGYQSFVVTAYYEDGTSRTVSDYTITEVPMNLAGTHEVTVTYIENGIIKTTPLTIVMEPLKTQCEECGLNYYLDEQDVDHGCPFCREEIIGIQVSPTSLELEKGAVLPILVELIYKNGRKVAVADWDSDYNPNLLGWQDITVFYHEFQTTIYVDVKDKSHRCDICGTEYFSNEDDEDNEDIGCPSCKSSAILIEVTPKYVAIPKNHPLDIVVLATFRDGHKEEIYDWETDFIGDTCGEFEVTIKYQSVTDMIRVTVYKDSRIVCPYCSLEYDFYHSPKGCPVCYDTVIGLEAWLRNGGQSVVVNAPLSLDVVLIYQDTHRAYIDVGYIVEGYHPGILGWQSIIVRYQDFSFSFDIEIIDNLSGKICPHGHEYYLDEVGSDPGCPFCAYEEDKENAIVYFEIIYTEAIIKTLYRNGKYQLQSGDYFTITYIPKDLSRLKRLQRMFFGTARNIKKSYTYGGEVIR